MTMPIPSRRPACPICLRAQSACICRWIAPVAHAAEVLILQHPLEAGNAKGSARLLHLSLPQSRLVTGEAFPETALDALLHAPFGQGGDARCMAAARQPVLLYPDTPDSRGAGMPAPPALDGALLRAPGRVRLVVLDGTWRKSRKMLYMNPPLQRLPRLALSDAPASQYLIRKAHGAHQLSTLEAACYALMRLEADEAKYQPLLEAFNGFVAQQMGYRAAGR